MIKSKIFLSIFHLNIEKLLVRKINVVDNVPPELTIASDETVYIDENGEYVQPAYSASDNYDGDLTSKVKVDGSVDVNKVGEYKQTYTVSDSSKNETKKEIKIIEGIAKGLSNKEISEEMFLSEGTIKNMVPELMQMVLEKIEVHDLEHYTVCFLDGTKKEILI